MCLAGNPWVSFGISPNLASTATYDLSPGFYVWRQKYRVTRAASPDVRSRGHSRKG